MVFSLIDNDIIFTIYFIFTTFLMPSLKFSCPTKLLLNNRKSASTHKCFSTGLKYSFEIQGDILAFTNAMGHLEMEEHADN